jgi:transcriptional regulator with XRE-family HTH domain
MNYSEIFKLRRVRLNLSMQEFGLSLGVTRQAVWAVEKGATKPSLELIESLVRLSGPLTIEPEGLPLDLQKKGVENWP